jgi:nucleoside-diphosphate-sugar epimerase
MKTVGIIGGAGFIGSHNTQKFLKEGYKIKVSVTDISKEEKYKHLKDLPNSENIEFVEMDVTNKSQLEGFLDGCSIVVHGGTPFQLDVKDPKTELFDPIVKGTENFLDLVQKTEGIEKVVFIASIASYNANFPMLLTDKTDEEPINENTPPFISDECHPYGQAKFIANQAVDKFIANNPNLDFEVVTVSPVFVTGNPMSQREDSTSAGMQFLFKNKIAPNPFVQALFDHDVPFAMVDVEDVAESIYKAATSNGFHGRNYILSSESYGVSDISLMLNKNEPAGSPKIVYSGNLAKKELGINFRPAVVPLNRYSD